MIVSFLPTFANAQKPKELELLLQTYTDNKDYNWVCWLTTHNSFAYRRDKTGAIENKYYINPNQRLDIKEQLGFGVRGFTVDLYYEEDDPNKPIILAHRGSEKGIKYYKQKFSSPFLETIEKWLRNNPQDIVTIHLESYVRNYEKIKKEIEDAGLKKYLFNLCEYNGGFALTSRTHCALPEGKELESKSLRWPTLGEMRKSDKRLVIFSDKAEDAGYGIMHVSNIMETQYDIVEFSVCEKRLEGRAERAPVFVMNHFHKYTPIPTATTSLALFQSLRFIIDSSADLIFTNPNQYKNLVLRAGMCYLQEGQWPNFLVVDDVGSEQGGERQIVLAINKNNKKCACINQDSIAEKNHEDKNKESNQHLDFEHDEL